MLWLVETVGMEKWQALLEEYMVKGGKIPVRA